MERTGKLATWAAIVYGAIVLFDWGDGYHLLAGTLIVGVGFVALSVFKRWRGRGLDPVKVDAAGAALPRALLTSALGACVAVLGLLGGFRILDAAGVEDRVYDTLHDKDRPKLEGEIRSLSGHGLYAEAVQVIEERLNKPLSDNWARTLRSDLYRFLIEAGKSAERAQKASYFERALEVAREAPVDPSVAQSYLENARREAEVAGLQEVEKKTRSERIETLKRDRRFPELEALLQLLLNEPKPFWPCPLGQELFDLYVTWGDSVPQSGEKVDLYRKAEQVGKEFELDVAPARARIQAIEAEEAARAEVAAVRAEEEARRKTLEEAMQERQSTLRQAIAKRIDSLRKEKRYAELAAYLRSKMAEAASEQWHHPYPRLLFETLLAWGDEAAQPREKLPRYEEALELCGRHGIDPAPARARLERARAQVLAEDRSRLPRDLPPGCRGGIDAVHTHGFPLTLLCEVWIEGPDGVPISDLQSKDFHASLAEAPVEAVRVTALRRRAEPLWIVVVLDVSGSMQGGRLDLAERAGRAFLLGLEGSGAQVSVIVFSDEAEMVCRWTADLGDAARSIDRLKAGGGTALYRAIWEALEIARGKEGRKRIFVFSDGEDSGKGERTLEEVITRAKSDEVAVFTVALEAKAGPLERLAAETGGEYAEAAGSEELEASFKKASRRIRQSFYKLQLDLGMGTPAGTVPLVVRMGRANALTLECEVTLGDAAPATGGPPTGLSRE